MAVASSCLLAACGSSQVTTSQVASSPTGNSAAVTGQSKTPGATTTNPSPTAAEQFTCQLAGIQEAQNSQVQTVPQPSSTTLGGQAAYITQQLPILDHEIAQLQNLTPAPAQASEFQSLLSALEQTSALEHQELSALEQDDAAQYNQLTKQLQTVSFGPIPSLFVGSCAGRLKRALNGAV